MEPGRVSVSLGQSYKEESVKHGGGPIALAAETRKEGQGEGLRDRIQGSLFGHPRPLESDGVRNVLGSSLTGREVLSKQLMASKAQHSDLQNGLVASLTLQGSYKLQTDV